MKNVKFIQLEIFLDRLIQNTANLGALTLSRDGREYILDVVSSNTYGEPDCGEATEIYCALEIDEDTFDECKYDLTAEDLLAEDLKAEFYIGCNDEDFEVVIMELVFEIDGNRHKIKVSEEV